MKDSEEIRWLFLEASPPAVNEWTKKMWVKMGDIQVFKDPTRTLCMAVAEESAAGELFCVGEILFSECEVLYRGRRFSGRALFDDSPRAFALALLEAAITLAPNVLNEMAEEFEMEKQRLEEVRQKTSRALGSTRVTFETMNLT